MLIVVGLQGRLLGVGQDFTTTQFRPNSTKGDHAGRFDEGGMARPQRSV